MATTFEGCTLDGTRLDGTTGSVVVKGGSSVKDATFAGAKISLRVDGPSIFTGTSFAGAHLRQQYSITSSGVSSAEVQGLDLTGATVTVVDPYTGKEKETVSATSPLVVPKTPEDTAFAVVPGFALQTGAADRKVEIVLRSNETECESRGGTAIAPLELEEFVKTLDGWFAGHNIVATTKGSKASDSVVRSEINLCKDEGTIGARSDARVFPQLTTRISLDPRLSPAAAQLKAAEAVFRSLGRSFDTSTSAYRMFVGRYSKQMPPQDPKYLSVMDYKYLEALVGEDPALAGCTLSVGLKPGEFKIVAGNVEVVVDPKFCAEKNEFGFTCHFNQQATAVSNTSPTWRTSLSASVNIIEDKDGNIKGYVIAVNGMEQVSGAGTNDTMHCPAPPTPTPTPTPTQSDYAATYIAFGSLICAGLICRCLCCCSRNNPAPAVAAPPPAAHPINPAPAAIVAPPPPLPAAVIPPAQLAAPAQVYVVFLNPGDAPPVMGIEQVVPQQPVVLQQPNNELHPYGIDPAAGDEEELKIAADGSVHGPSAADGSVHGPRAAQVAPAPRGVVV
jgi:hypothetical protein